MLNFKKALVATDVVTSQLRYDQLKFKYLIFLGKLITGAVVNEWMAEVLFDKDTAAGKLAKNQELRKYLLQKTRATARKLYEELAR